LDNLFFAWLAAKLTFEVGRNPTAKVDRNISVLDDDIDG